MLATPTGRTVTFLGRSPRARLISRIEDIVGRDRIRLLWLPDGTDVLGAFDDSLYRRPATHSHTAQGRLTRQGYGWLLASTTAGTQRVTISDADSLSFGNGTADVPMSAFVVGNSTDTAAARRFVTKSSTAGTAREWVFGLSATDLLALTFTDEDTDVGASRVSSGAITMGSLRSWGFSYNGGGGATAADGMGLFQDGTTFASAATNNASYVSMVNTATNVEIGAASADSQYNDGSLGLILVWVGNGTTGQHRALVTDATNPYFEVNR